MAQVITPESIRAEDVKRFCRAMAQADEYELRLTERASTVEIVKKATGDSYRVTERTCSCPDAAKRPLQCCKHRVLASDHFARPEVKAAASAQAESAWPTRADPPTGHGGHRVHLDHQAGAAGARGGRVRVAFAHAAGDEHAGAGQGCQPGGDCFHGVARNRVLTDQAVLSRRQPLSDTLLLPVSSDSAPQAVNRQAEANAANVWRTRFMAIFEKGVFSACPRPRAAGS